ncbi:RIP metalloprotease RseP [bacterium]|nr:RIP metalloprotease RseP [candidate division CSSED10-310 bacterium]
MIESILAFIVVLGILVFTHELGHFLLAKKNDVRVHAFSLGFGPILLKHTRGETEYRLSAIPLGGYVKLAGENPDDILLGDGRDLLSKSVLQRFSIFFAGPAMNILLAIAVNIAIGIIGFRIPAYLDTAPVIEWVRGDSPAAAAGLQTGDIIRSIDEESVETWEDVFKSIRLDSASSHQVTVARQGIDVEIQYVPLIDQSTGLAEMDFGPRQSVLIAGVSENFPAAAAGIRENDKLVAINGEPVYSSYTVQRAVQGSEGQAVEVTVDRAGEGEQHITISPRFDKAAEQWLIGISFVEQVEQVYRKLSLPAAVARGFTETWQWTVQIYAFLGKLIVGKAPVKSLGGPILIAKVAGEAWRTGLDTLLNFLAFISINLAVINLLPIPVLDGGHILFLLPEIVTRRQVSERTRMIASNIGFVFLLGLIALTLVVDLTR